MLQGMLKLPDFEVYIPKTPAEAARARFRLKDSEFIAGGTEIIPRIMRRELRPKTLIDLSGLSQLRYIKPGKKVIRVGALTALGELLSHPEILRHQAFKDMVEKHSSPTIMNMATVGGSISTRSNVSDLLTISLALRGRVKVIGRRGSSTIEVERFLMRRIKGLVAELAIPAPSQNTVSLFDKIALSSSKYSLASISLYLRVDGRRVVRGAGVAVNCAREGRPGRVKKVERLMVGRKLSRKVFEEAAERLYQSIQPHTDFMAPDWYRMTALKAMFRRLGARALETLLRGGNAD